MHDALEALNHAAHKPLKHNRLTSGEMLSNNWRAVGFGISHLALRDASGGCERSVRAGGCEAMGVALWQSWTRRGPNRRVGGGYTGVALTWVGRGQRGSHRPSHLEIFSSKQFR